MSFSGSIAGTGPLKPYMMSGAEVIGGILFLQSHLRSIATTVSDGNGSIVGSSRRTEPEERPRPLTRRESAEPDHSARYHVWEKETLLLHKSIFLSLFSFRPTLLW